MIFNHVCSCDDQFALAGVALHVELGYLLSLGDAVLAVYGSSSKGKSELWISILDDEIVRNAFDVLQPLVFVWHSSVCWQPCFILYNTH